MDFHLWLQNGPISSSDRPSKSSIESVLALSEEGGTIPFIARYRKEKTGNLDEVQIENILSWKEQWENLEKRRDFVIKELTIQKQLTSELKNKLEATCELTQIEDIYLPFKKKRKTKATVAKELGLEVVSEALWNACLEGSEKSPQDFAREFLENSDSTLKEEEILKGAGDILVEKISENADAKQSIRENYLQNSFLQSKQNTKNKGTATPHGSKFDKYFAYSESVRLLLQKENSHRYLAIRRGWLEEELTIKITGAPDREEEFDEKNIKFFEKLCGAKKNSASSEFLKKCCRLALKAYVGPSIEKEVHKHLKELADFEAIRVFSNNIKKVLLSPPLGTKVVLGIDPGIRTGCKFAVVSETASPVEHGVFHLNSPQGIQNFTPQLEQLIKKHKIFAIAVGNGTAGRETEETVRKALDSIGNPKLPVIMVNESGASIYSASEVARKEFPELDLTIRGAISIARRLQDPLAELVKIDPKSIGVGQYQHDVSQPSLKKALESVVDTCVNQVGVELNTASEYLLARVSGIGPSLAKNIISHRAKSGPFQSREALKTVPRFSEKIYEQSAGFLRLKGSQHPLDNTGVHPERYSDIEEFFKNNALDIHKMGSDSTSSIIQKSAELKSKWGPFTHKDIVEELKKPGRDPRENFEITSFRPDISEVSDLKVGMICPGVVTNVTNFGAFVDIGVHQDGLVHISQLSNNFVKDPNDVVSAGDSVKVKVIELDVARKRVALSMKLEDSRERPKQMKDRQNSNTSRTKLRSQNKSFGNNAFAQLASLKQGSNKT
jgi:uncharacterized protein